MYLVLADSAVLEYQLGTTSDRIVVVGALTLGGRLNIANSGGLVPGTYTLFTYTGALTNNVLSIGTNPTSSWVYKINLMTPGQVRLDVNRGGFIMSIADAKRHE